MTSYGDVFVATGMVAALTALGNRTGDLIRIDPPIGGGLGKIPRLAIGQRGMGATFFTPGETLVDAIPVCLIGKDENTAVGRRGGCRECEHTGQER